MKATGVRNSKGMARLRVNETDDPQRVLKPLRYVVLEPLRYVGMPFNVQGIKQACCNQVTNGFEEAG